MKLHVLAAVLALAVTPALAQSDTSTQAPGAMDGQTMHKSTTHKKKTKKHHTRTSQSALPSNCKHTVKTMDTQKAEPCS
jgi:uncharacterized protein YdeI (BOF family)